MTETAAMADIVLPATTFLEHDDIYVAGGHTYLQVTKAVIDPLGECRSNHQVLCGLAQRLGASHPGFEMSAWEMIDRTLKASGLPDAETVHAGKWHDCALPFEEMHFLNGFGHADKRFHFRADWSAYGPNFAVMPALPGHNDGYDQKTAERPYRLVAAPARSFLNTSFTETPGSQKREDRPTILIHPEAARAIGVGNGDRLRIGNDLGSLVIEVELFDGLQQDVVVVESIWPNSAFEEGRGINLLISADPGPPAGGAVFHDTAVWLRPA